MCSDISRVMLLRSGVPCMLRNCFKVYHEWCVTVLRCIANGVQVSFKVYSEWYVNVRRCILRIVRNCFKVYCKWCVGMF